jgi:hypothetical protein
MWNAIIKGKVVPPSPGVKISILSTEKMAWQIAKYMRE